MYLHGLQCSNNIHSALLDVQRAVLRLVGVASALSVIPAYYFYYGDEEGAGWGRDKNTATSAPSDTAADDRANAAPSGTATDSKDPLQARVKRLIGSRRWPAMRIGEYCWHKHCLLLTVAPHPLLAALATGDVDGMGATESAGVAKGEGVAGETSDLEGAAAAARTMPNVATACDCPDAAAIAEACRARGGVFLCYSDTLAPQQRERVLSSLPSLPARAIRVLQYVVSEWTSTARSPSQWAASPRLDITQTIILQKWIKLASAPAPPPPP